MNKDGPFIRVVERPARKLILKWSTSAEDYFSYAEELGCGETNISSPWDILRYIKCRLDEPVGLWIPQNLRPEGTGSYAHGVEVPADYSTQVPEGFVILDLAPCTYLLFQGEPYEEEDFMLAIATCRERIDAFNPEELGYRYTPELAPHIQFAPEGSRGYMEMLPVQKL